MNDGRLYRTIWRWHFYAGLFVLPFIFALSLTGSIYLFKPQVDRWEERAFRSPSADGAVSPDAQLIAARAAYPDGSFNHYRLAERPGDAAMIQMGLPGGGKREVFVSPQGQVMGTLDPDTRLEEIVAQVHGSLLLGTVGDWLVELAASWTIVLILSGLYLWWPRPFTAAGTLYPRLSLRDRFLLKDIHRVAGFWIAGLVLVMLASGLPWAGAWGSAFKWVRTELHMTDGPQNWKVGAAAPAAEHDHSAMMAADVPMPMPSHAKGLPLSAFVVKAQAEHMAFPVVVLPPHAPQRFGPPTGDDWTVKSETQNRPLTRQVTYDAASGTETGRSGFGDKHVIDRVVNTGIAWHEGQLFGWVNQLIGVLTAALLVAISGLGVWMWLKRRPPGAFGAPQSVPLALSEAPLRSALAVLAALALLLPLFGLSLVALLVVDRVWTWVRKYRSA